MSSKWLARFCDFWPASRLTCVRLVAAMALCGSASVAAADVVSFGGTITQPQDPTNPATNNPTLNNIQLNDAYTVTLTFAGSITAPGTYGGGTLTFTDAAAGATESSFGSISLTITANGTFDDFSLLGCLTTGNGCLVGNQLDASFRIPATSLNLQNVAAVGLDQPHPLDLLEDDGSTDIHGSIVTYSYVPTVPEPSSALLVCVGLAVVAARACRRLTHEVPQRGERA
jgi:hypothetical protein